MGIADSEPFTILFNYDASQAEVDAAIDSFDPSTPCPGDFDGNGVVDGADFGILLASWGGLPLIWWTSDSSDVLGASSSTSSVFRVYFCSKFFYDISLREVHQDDAVFFNESFEGREVNPRGFPSPRGLRDDVRGHRG